ncbi:MAG: hypothetical protein N4J56_002515 [Chroococcidiopsis sp. SAG 2025]|uniref:hypothetical protein n=1 Tax=Chroococcidiopsis sp. SAG 2025 TaxID=171389 RepID=UPI0029371484|nr:hypothetical protein [Chroococcidiopsis sp. SAG 2025]MDV2992861.1 hypothetical protein [Chroococcidiopsis sp. SAG 2025]
MKSYFDYVYLPYCIQKQANGKFVVLNRHYKPLGTLSSDWVDYAPHEVKLRLKDTEYLYDDGCIPHSSNAAMKQYLDKLARLARFKISS